jgi:ribosomal protein S18 acetylase RimI-like enzyme
MQTGDVAGIYTMGVLESARRNGIGKAVACELLRTGRAEGCEVAVSQSSEMAKSLYEDLVFEPVTTYHHFARTN